MQESTRRHLLSIFCFFGFAASVHAALNQDESVASISYFIAHNNWYGSGSPIAQAFAHAVIVTSNNTHGTSSLQLRAKSATLWQDPSTNDWNYNYWVNTTLPTQGINFSTYDNTNLNAHDNGNGTVTITRTVNGTRYIQNGGNGVNNHPAALPYSDPVQTFVESIPGNPPLPTGTIASPPVTRQSTRVGISFSIDQAP